MSTYHSDIITHYYKRGTPPFRSLSSLSESEAVSIMKSLYDETLFGTRFKNPAQYLQNRRQSEKWVREEFILKGGSPILEFPIYFVLGESAWLFEHSPDKSLHSEIQISLSDFEEGDVSFTYPDSMISFRFGNDRPTDYYLPELHGKVFTRNEILCIVKCKGDPEKDWQTKLSPTHAPYIEAQVWNMCPLIKYIN
jgi:hypothetical protein